MAVEIGSKVTGKVTGITNFGAFVDLGSGQSGLVHISEISNQYVKDIHDVLSVGDMVTVKVVSVQANKIGLSIKQASEQSAAPANHSHAPHHEQQHHREHRENDSSNNNWKRGNSGGRPSNNHQSHQNHQDFDSMLSGFLKDSEDRLTAIKRNTEGKRGGRGGRRS
ncbi:S1 domain-containing RNA-binding protein [Lapidilactobacillus gannanensis]|jgi:S1 RNA binding domain protein|uniref:S1 domain-containing RNA-binding protein n=1 Tax=Lapidilactobacillus gannanensis TaxID=2486002 RepID=A0ABW4BKM7_9LACO|nr:S1 domain-containing RNA-binding protein [Lapidilactobacillus gannanensis]MCH4057635.1 S1 domain-containing RNA-binding protein [Lactobacillaceae bacterium]